MKSINRPLTNALLCVASIRMLRESVGMINVPIADASLTLTRCLDRECSFVHVAMSVATQI